MKLIASVISAVITLTASLAGIIVLMLVAHVTIDVVMRFAFDARLPNFQDFILMNINMRSNRDILADLTQQSLL